MSERGAVEITRSSGVATLRLSNPPHNAIGLPQVEALESLLPELASDAAVRAVVIQGAGGRSFSAGADLKEEADPEVTAVRARFDRMARLLRSVERMQKPVIAAIRGSCLGGGLELALACHLRVAAEDAVFGVPEVRLGLAPGWGGCTRLARTVGRGRALDLLLHGRRIGASEAAAWGLVNEVVAPLSLEAHVEERARALAEGPPLAMATLLAAVIEGEELALDAAVRREQDAIARLAGTADAREGVAAFLEKRPPRFEGR